MESQTQKGCASVIILLSALFMLNLYIGQFEMISLSREQSAKHLTIPLDQSQLLEHGTVDTKPKPVPGSLKLGSLEDPQLVLDPFGNLTKVKATPVNDA